MLDFQNISIDLKPTIDKYYYMYGEGSCQHSFATSFCFNEKYDDFFCVKNNFLYTLRNGLSDDRYRTYLFPIGDTNNLDEVKVAVENVLLDAKESGRKVKFQSVTEKAMSLLKELFGDRFIIEDQRDLYEYLYKYETLAIMEGSHFKSKRNEIRKFFSVYDNISIKRIDKNDIVSIENLYELWIDEDSERKHNTQLDYEKHALDRALQYYEVLGLDGISVYDGKEIIGFVFGVKLNDKVFDYMIEKANASYRGIYKVLNNELAKVCCSEYEFLNFEEDLGEEGLRNSKMMYHPDIMLKKYIVTEV